MPLNIRPTTSIERKNLFLETLLNNTDKVSKVSPDAVLSGVGAGVAKVSGKSEKDIILALSQLFPDTAYGSQLDQVLSDAGLPARFGAAGSSTYVRLNGTPGTVYNQSVNIFQSTAGIQFQLDASSVTIPSFGFTYAAVHSLTSGAATNVDPLTISQVSPVPSGHLNVINETKAANGRDVESDELVRIRIKDGPNILARGTIAMIEQKFMSINQRILKVFYNGINTSGQIRLSIVTQDGSALTTGELSALLNVGASYFTLTEMQAVGTNFYGVELVNITYSPFDISLRLQYDTSYNLDQIRIQMQVAISKYIDFRFFNPVTDRIDWVNLLEICRNIPGVIYIPDEYFFPNIDIAVDVHQLPRLRGFLILDLTGAVIQNFTGTLSPVYYPAVADFEYQQTVLNNI